MHKSTPLGANDRRTFRLALAVLATTFAAALATTAWAAAMLPAGADATTTSIKPAVVTPVSVSDGLLFTGATISAPHKATRRLSPYQTATFVQGWLAQAIVGHPRHTNPPAGTTIYRVDTTGTWGGGTEYTTRAVYYASTGTQAWISFPSPVIVPPTGAPAKLDFFEAPPLVIPAFNGTGKLIPSVGDATAPSSSVPATGPASTSSGGSSSRWIWLVGAVAVGAVVGLVGWLRRRAASSSKRSHR